MHEQLLAEEVILQLITEDINALLTMLPSHKEIKASSFALIKDSAPVLEGFGTFFYQFLWDKSYCKINFFFFLSVSIYGKAHGYFNCTRGVKHGNPLSPLIFYLAEDVLSRSISKLVLENKMELIIGTRNIKVHPHTFYADDLMFVCSTSYHSYGINS